MATDPSAVSELTKVSAAHQDVLSGWTSWRRPGSRQRICSSKRIEIEYDVQLNKWLNEWCSPLSIR